MAVFNRFAEFVYSLAAEHPDIAVWSKAQWVAHFTELVKNFKLARAADKEANGGTVPDQSTRVDEHKDTVVLAIRSLRHAFASDSTIYKSCDATMDILSRLCWTQSRGPDDWTNRLLQEVHAIQDREVIMTAQ